MRIAHLLPTSAVFPLVKHNGRYEWALRLAKLQVASGHEVTIFAGNKSGEGTVTWRTTEPSDASKRERNLELLHLAFEDDSFDVYHSHFDSLHYRSEERRVGKECRSRW